MARSTGRPPKFDSVDDLQEKIDAYFDACDEQERPYTVTGLAVALDTSRETLIDYEKKDRYSDTIKKAKLRIEQYAEEQLYRSSGQVAGIIFNLKNNWGWQDAQSMSINYNRGSEDTLTDEEAHLAHVSSNGNGTP